MPVDGSFAFVMIPARDLNRAQTFFVAVFSWNFLTKSPTAPGPRLFFTGGESMGGLTLCKCDDEGSEAATAPKPPGSSVITYIKVRDMAVAIDKIVKAGGKVATQPYMAGQNELAEFEDTEGNVLGLIKWNFK